MIHAGLYYGANTLKTTLCIKGRKMLYDLCAKNSIPHRNTKKWIVAQTHREWQDCLKLHAFAQTINVPTRIVSLDEGRRREPDVRAQTGILESETTGIVDSHGLMTFLQGDFEDRGGDCAFQSAVTHIQRILDDVGKECYKVTVKDHARGEESSMTTKVLINSAGLYACAISNMLLPSERHQTPCFAKGSYFSYSASSPHTSTLIYPAPPSPKLGGLGTHLTMDMAGRIRFGPDVEWVDDPTNLTPRGNDDDDGRLDAALQEVRKYLPGVQADAFQPDYCGIRPKLLAKGEEPTTKPRDDSGAVVSDGSPTGSRGSRSSKNNKVHQDFIIRTEEGFPGFVNLLGIESPGLTSCLAIADMVEGLVYRR